MADKLDILMESLFHYLHDVTHINGKNSLKKLLIIYSATALICDNLSFADN